MTQKEMLHEVRRQMDAIDIKLLALLEERMEVTETAASIKRDNNLPIQDNAREQEIVDKLVERADSKYKASISMLMRTMLALSRARQRQLLLPATEMLPPSVELDAAQITCACVGAQGSQERQALELVYPDAKALAVSSCSEVFESVKSGKANCGIAAIEDARLGAVAETYDLLRSKGCYIVGKVEWKGEGDANSYVLIAANPQYDAGSSRVSITFTAEHRSGALCETLMPFHAQGINLTSIESSRGTGGSFRFFAELEGNIQREDTLGALRQAAETCAYFEVLGCYKVFGDNSLR